MTEAFGEPPAAAAVASCNNPELPAGNAVDPSAAADPLPNETVAPSSAPTVPPTHHSGEPTTAWVEGHPVAVKKTNWPKGPLQLFKLVAAVEYTCRLCKALQNDYRVATADRVWAQVICGRCYDRLANKKPYAIHKELEAMEGREPPSHGRKRGADDVTEEGEGTGRDGEPTAKVPRTEPMPRVPTRMCALLVGYQGTGFCGLQVNPGVPTVEQTILDALIRVGYLPPTSPNELHRHGWQRASRTDKGVHAARNVLGIRLCVAEDVTDDTIVTTLNQELPSVIRILGVLRTTKHFNAKTEASRRVYQYVVPTFAFLNDYARYFPEPLGDFVGSEAPEEDSDPEAPPKPSKQEDNFHLAEVPLPAGSFEALAQYRISPERLARVRALLKGYEGTQSYHNFTKRMKATDPQAMRYIIGFSCSDPYELDGIELVTLEVNGQSFLLNQIRKMVGLVMIMVSADLPDDVLHRALDPAHTLNIPPAPGLNLLLLDLAFDRYRHRLQHDTNGRRPIEWPEKDEEVAAFRASLCRHIVTLERTNHTACRWMYALRRNVHRFLGLRLPSEPPLPPVADIPPETAA